MCLLLYVGCDVEIELRTTFEFSVEAVEPEREAVKQWFTGRHIYFVAAHGTCSCAFPHVIAEQPIEYYEGFFDDEPDREMQLAAIHALLDQIAVCLTQAAEVQIYPVWDGQEAESPKGIIQSSFGEIRPETFFFVEQFFYRISRADDKRST